MSAGKITLQAGNGKLLNLSAPNSLNTDKNIIPANINGDNTQTFKVADAVNADEAVNKLQMNNNINNNIAYAYITHDAQTTAKDTNETLNFNSSHIEQGINVYSGQSNNEDYIEIVSDGIYEIVTKLNTINGNNNSSFYGHIDKNGYSIAGTKMQNNSITWVSISSSCIISCVTGDKIKIVIDGQVDSAIYNSTKITKIEGV